MYTRTQEKRKGNANADNKLKGCTVLPEGKNATSRKVNEASVSEPSITFREEKSPKVIDGSLRLPPVKKGCQP